MIEKIRTAIKNGLKTLSLFILVLCTSVIAVASVGMYTMPKEFNQIVTASLPAVSEPVEEEKLDTRQPTKEEQALRTIREEAHTFGVPPVLALAITQVESGASMKHDRMRYEPRLQSKFKREGWMNEIEYQMYATSFGYMQVIYGLHRDNCGLQSFADLFDPDTNIKCGLTVLKACIDRHHDERDKTERFRKALVCYNGGSTYPDKVFNEMTKIVLRSF